MTERTSIPIMAGVGRIQVMRTRVDAPGVGAHQVSIGASFARNTTAFASKTRVIEVYTDVACYFRQGDVTVEATSADFYLPATTGRLYSLGGDQLAHAPHFAVIQVASAGTLYINELE